mgnify:CR=1 FL=1
MCSAGTHLLTSRLNGFSCKDRSSMVSQIKNKSVHFRRIFGVTTKLAKICFQRFQKVHFSILPQFDWAFLLEKQNGLESWLWFCDCPQGHWPVSWSLVMPIYHLAILNSINQVHSPQNNENTVQFCGDFLTRKGKGQSLFAAKWK